MFGVLALEQYFATGPPNGWKLICLTSLFAVVPTQIVLTAGWTAIGQPPWLRRTMVGVGILLWIDVLLLVADVWIEGHKDFGGLVVQGFPAILVHGVILWLAAFAVFRPFSIAWEFGQYPGSDCRGQFRLVDIGEWTVAVALPLALIQVLDSIGRWTLMGTLVCGLVLTISVVVVVSGGLWRNRTVVTLILATAMVFADATTLFSLHYFGYAQQTWIPTMLGGLVIQSFGVANVRLTLATSFNVGCAVTSCTCALIWRNSDLRSESAELGGDGSLANRPGLLSSLVTMHPSNK